MKAVTKVSASNLHKEEIIQHKFIEQKKTIVKYFREKKVGQVRQ